MGHWSLALGVACAWLTKSGWGVWHERAGYAAAAIALIRVFAGLWGPMNLRFRTFVVSPAATRRYARQVFAHQERRYVRHNPLGAWMVIALLANVILVGLSGWLYTTDRFWGEPWVESLHSMLADSLMVLVTLHVVGVLHGSYRHGENLVAAMLHGHKRGLD